jgi:subtilisin family serine protease
MTVSDSATPANGSPFPREFAAGDVVLTLTPDQVYVVFAESLRSEEITDLIARSRLRPVREAPDSSQEQDRTATLSRGRWLQSATSVDIASLITQLRADDQVLTANPVYHRADLLPAITGASFADRLLVRFAPRATGEEIEAFIAEQGAEVVKSAPDAREGPLYQLRLRSPKSQEVFAVAAELARSPLVRYAAPDWIQLHPASSATPNDPNFSQQWNLSRIGAPAAWDISRGSSDVVIAIVDSGCDLTHRDLVNKYVPLADRRDVINGTNTPNDVRPGGGHGTLCAGVAAAETDNGQGAAGVGWNCSIMPISIIDASDRIQSEMDIVAAIDWARTHGADVVSMSWHWDLTHANADVALDNAHAAGLVLVAASGNCFTMEGCTNPKLVDFPASHPEVIAVGGSDQSDQRKQPVSTETRPWHSRYGAKLSGAELSVVAPGVIPWTTSKGGGFGNFWGTSAAAPHVAGLAALLLSLLQQPVNVPPGLQRNDLVRNIIEWTAAKVGGYGYATDAAHPNGTWHEEMGYGRIDAAFALRYARDNFTTYKLERPSQAYAVSVQILLGLTGGGAGVVLPHGGPPVPVDPGWDVLAPETQDVLLGLAVTELAMGINDLEARRALRQAGREVIERAAQRIGHD